MNSAYQLKRLASELDCFIDAYYCLRLAGHIWLHQILFIARRK